MLFIVCLLYLGYSCVQKCVYTYIYSIYSNFIFYILKQANKSFQQILVTKVILFKIWAEHDIPSIYSTLHRCVISITLYKVVRQEHGSVTALWNYDRQTDRPTNQQTDMTVYEEIRLPKIGLELNSKVVVYLEWHNHFICLFKLSISLYDCWFRHSHWKKQKLYLY